MFHAILSIAANNPDGFTVEIPSLRIIEVFENEGIVVAYSETQDSFGEDGLKKVIAHALAHDKLVGGWLEDERLYFDSVRIFPETQLEEALEFARIGNQLAVFRLSDGKVIKL